MRAGVALLVVATGLAACGAPAADPRLAACQQQALSDPLVIVAIERANSQLQEVRVPGVREQKIAMDRAVQRCLGGPQVRGGVEPVQRQQ